MSDELCSPVSPIWQQYEALQNKSRKIRKLDSYAWAVEDQLDRALSLAQAAAPATEDGLAKSLKELRLNRIKKHSRRRRLLQKFVLPVLPDVTENTLLDRIQLERAAMAFRSTNDGSDWRILVSIARGADYGAIAGREGTTVSALKSRVSRCRRRLAELAA